jgi:Ca2+-binding EF-hand superfamily protein
VLKHELGGGCSYQMGGQDWAMLFDSYDKDGSGGLDEHEFTATVRNDAGIPPHQFSDNEVANLFFSIDIDRYVFHSDSY